MANTNAAFALDLDLLEKEIEAKEQDRRSKAYTELSGQIAGAPGTSVPKPRRSSAAEPSHDTDFDTLDEPIWDTITRDLKLVSAKFAQVLVPAKKEQNVLKDWDLWGPLFICVALSLILQGNVSDKGPQFTQVFSLAFFGSCMVTLNIKLLGGKISFFQTLCVIGYCLLPSVFGAITCKIFALFIHQRGTLHILKLVLAGFGFVWSTYASMSFLSGTQADNRRLLGLYPVILFYFIVSWLVLSNS
ncbi:yip1 domain-containing protein [Ditylenchus destructor]|uniref:Protein YIPF n=1 Tax=Ditylenchus destructor TaxID=166010 RepID=A0AAD4N735_9BILA|nr:yip1 domain-containing protein [Ditylenchus destructor]